MLIHICDIYPTCFFFLNRNPSVPAACIGKTATTGKVATQTTADTNQKSENTSKALITKAEQTNTAIKSGKHPSKAAEKEGVVTRKSPAESSSRDCKSEQTPETCSKVPVVVGKDTEVVDRSKDGTAVKAKPVLEAKVSKMAVPQTPSDPSVSLDGAGSALRVSSASTASDNQPLRKELRTTHGNGSAEIKERNITPEVAASGKTDDKRTARQPAASSAVTPSTKKGTINAEGIDTLISKVEMLLQVLQFDHCYYIFI